MNYDYCCLTNILDENLKDIYLPKYSWKLWSSRRLLAVFFLTHFGISKWVVIYFFSKGNVEVKK